MAQKSTKRCQKNIYSKMYVKYTEAATLKHAGQAFN